LFNFLITLAAKEVRDTKNSDKILTIINNLTQVRTFSLRKKITQYPILNLFKKYNEKNSALKKNLSEIFSLTLNVLQEFRAFYFLICCFVAAPRR